MTSQTQHLESIGHLACTLRVPVARVRRAAESAGVKPAISINSIDHYDAKACERIAEHLARGTTRVKNPGE